ncbi:MAG TPA: hypothetical protein VMV79_01145 [Alphaproteobacteria bacterium]|nr:hypothetical protein [Alphaproteobacteria bacterium]
MSFISHQSFASNSRSDKLYDVILQDIPGGGRVLDIGFYKKLPPPSVIDHIVRQSLDNAVLIFPAIDILAEAFHGNDTLNSDQYGGPLIYKAGLKKVEKFWKPEQWGGVKIPTTSFNSYYTEVNELATYDMSRKWLNVTIVFSQKPSQQIAYNAIRTEAKKLAMRKEDMDLYVEIGDKNRKASWKQIKGTDGTYISAEYSVATKKLMHDTKLLQQMK